MSFSLHRRKNSPYWYAHFRTPDPDRPGELKQHLKSTKATSKEDAKAKAREIEEATLLESGAGNDKSRRIYALLKQAADIAAKGHLNEARGRKLLSDMIQISTGKGIKSYTVREWFAACLADKEKANAAGTYLRYKGVVNQFMDFLPAERADGNLMILTPEDIRDFRDAELASGKSPNTVNDAVKTLRTSLNKARRQQILLSNPAEAVETLPEDGIEKAVFTASDLTKLLSVAGGSWRGVILFGYYVGANLRDITNLRWSQVDLEKGTVSYSRKKTGRAVMVPLHTQLSDWLLDAATSDDPNAPVFPDLAGKSTAGKSGLSMKFGRLMKQAGLKGESVAPAKGAPGEKTKGRARNTLTFHSLRHSFNSAMANAGVLQEVRQKLTGHSSASTNAVYTHHDIENLRNAVNLVPQISDQVGGGDE